MIVERAGGPPAGRHARGVAGMNSHEGDGRPARAPPNGADGAVCPGCPRRAPVLVRHSPSLAANHALINGASADCLMSRTRESSPRREEGA